jgi:hypothetical protein
MGTYGVDDCAAPGWFRMTDVHTMVYGTKDLNEETQTVKYVAFQQADIDRNKVRVSRRMWPNLRDPARGDRSTRAGVKMNFMEPAQACRQLGGLTSRRALPGHR